MAGEAVIFGFNGVLQRNTATYGSPTWSACSNVRNCRLKMEPVEVDVTRRASGGYTETETGLMNASIEFDLILIKDENGAFPADIDALIGAAVAKTSIELACTDISIASEGAKGLRATCKLFGMDRGEQLQEGMTVSLTAKPTYAANAPSWHETAEGT
mgnify:FL=1